MNKLSSSKIKKENGVIGIGSPLLDIIINVDDKTLLDLDLKKGEMHLISGEKSKELLKCIDTGLCLSAGPKKQGVGFLFF